MTKHGGGGGGYARGCRCALCRAAHTARIKRRQEERRAEIKADPTLAPHGSASTYQNWGCRCPECTTAHSTYCRPYGRAYYERQKAAK